VIGDHIVNANLLMVVDMPGKKMSQIFLSEKLSVCDEPLEHFGGFLGPLCSLYNTFFVLVSPVIASHSHFYRRCLPPMLWFDIIYR